MSTIEVGAEVAGLHIDEVAARSGSSVVYRATEVATGTSRAVKVLVSPDPSAKLRLLREAALLSRLDHPAVVRSHGFEVVGDDLVLITEWVEGESLSDHLRGNQLSYSDALDALRELAVPLDYLHRNGIVHRDVNGSNVMRRAGGSLVLIDLGIGHDVGSATLTNHDLVAGTPRYLAPEIIRGESATPASDQYSLAMLFYELLTGRRVFPDSHEIATALHHQIHTVPAPLDEVDPSIPSAVSAAVAQALSKDPLARFDSVGDFASAATMPATSHDHSPKPVARPLVLLGGFAAATLVVLTLAVLRPTSPADEVAGISATSILVAAEPNDAPSTEALPSTQPTAIEQPTAVEPALPEPATPDETSSISIEWPLGLAAQLQCNLLAGSDFANGSVPLDYFGDPPGRERVVDQGGFEDSWALQVGIADNFGQYAEIVPVVPGESYWFRGWFVSDGSVADAEMGISLLRADYTPLDVSVDNTLATDRPGFAEVKIDQVPPGSAFALPYLFKDSSPGTLLADELVFGLQTSCFEEISTGE